MSIHPRHDELHDFWHDHHEPVNPRRFDVLLIVAAMIVMLAFVLWMIWPALNDAVQASDDRPAICEGLSAWDCVARIEEGF